MATEQGLHAQVVMILQRESDDKNEKEKTKKYNFQGKSVISRRWFNLDHEWLKENFMTLNQTSIEKCIKLSLGVTIQKHFKCL